MLKIAQVSLLLALVLGFAAPAKASLLLEPVLGFNAGSRLEFEDGKSYSGGGGLGIGGRVGYQNLGFQLGLDYLKSSIDMRDNDIDKNVDMNEWAGFVGFEFPVLLRVYAGYIFSADGQTKSNGNKVELSEGAGTKLGVGFTVLPFLDINVEYRRGTFDETKIGGVKTGKETDYQSYMLAVSLPFTI